MRFVSSVVLALSVGIGAYFGSALGASSAYSQPQRAGDIPRAVKLTISGRGSVTLSKAFSHPVTLHCYRSCTHIYSTTHERSAITEKPYKGWKFAGWGGNCKNKTRTCVVDFTGIPDGPIFSARTHVSARFIR